MTFMTSLAFASMDLYSLSTEVWDLQARIEKQVLPDYSILTIPNSLQPKKSFHSSIDKAGKDH
jgi:hypothetical protein